MANETRRTGSRAARRVALALVALLAASVLLALPVEAEASTTAGQQFAASLPGSVRDVAAADGGLMVAATGAGSLHVFDGAPQGTRWDAPRAGPLADVVPSLDRVGVSDDGAWRFVAANWASFRDAAVYGFGGSSSPSWEYRVPGSGDVLNPNRIVALATSPGSPYVAVGTPRGEVILLDGDDARSPKYPVDIFTTGAGGQDLGSIAALGLGVDANRVVVGTRDRDAPSLHLYDRHRFLHTFTALRDPVSALAVSADGAYALVGLEAAGGARVALVDLAGRAVLWDWAAPSAVRSVALSEDGSVAAVGLEGGSLATFRKPQTVAGWKVPRVDGLGARVVEVAVAADGRHVAAVTSTGTLHFFAPALEDALWTFEVRRDATGLALSRDADTVVVGTAASGEQAGQAIYFAARRAPSLAGQTTYALVPGRAQAGALLVANDGNRLETVRLAACCAPAGWVLEVAEGPFHVAPGRSITLGFTATPSVYAKPADHVARFSAAFAGGVTRALDVTLGVPAQRGVGIDLQTTDLTIRAGQRGEARLVLVNFGLAAERATLSLEGVPTWLSTAFSPGNPHELAADATRDVRLKFAPPLGAPSTDIPVTVVAASADHVARAALRLRIVPVDGATPGEAVPFDPLPDAADAEREADPAGNGPVERAEPQVEIANNAPKGRKVPGFGLMAVVAALGVALLAAARRRNSP